MYDQADITCLVENEEGMGQDSTQLDVQFPPTILLHPRSQVAKRKDNVTFHCVAEGNPVPSYIWTVGRRDSLLQAGTQNLSLVASEKTEAVYRCQVGQDGDNEGEDHVVKDYVVDAIVMMKMLMMPLS